MRFKTDESTTGRVVSTMGVLTVLTMNAIEDRHLDGAEREQAMAELRAICSGGRGVEQKKVAARAVERCQMAVMN